MAAFFNPFPAAIPQRVLSRKPSPCIRILKWIWPFQSMIALARVFLITLVSVVMLLVALLEVKAAIAIWIICAIDLFVTLGIIVTVIKQYHDKETANATLTFRREALKTVFASYLWLWTLFTNPARVFIPTKTPREWDTKAQRIIAMIQLYMITLTLMVVLLFYPALWLAYQDWKTARDGERGGYARLEDGDGAEAQFQSLDRTSADSLGDLIEDDDSKVRK